MMGRTRRTRSQAPAAIDDRPAVELPSLEIGAPRASCFAGIDPGLEGCLAILRPGGRVTLADTPTLATGKGTRRDYDLAAMFDLVLGLPPGITVVIEQVQTDPKFGCVQSFRLGQGFGLWLGLLTAAAHPIERVTPQRWKGAMLAGLPKEKSASVLRAKELFPGADLRLKKHHNRADALLLAEWGRRNLR